MTTGTTHHLAAIPPLPTVRGGAGILPVVVVDTREQCPLPFARLPTVRGALYSGDYSIRGLETQFAIERKSIADLVSSCCSSNRERFENELHRLRGFRFRRLLVVGDREAIEAGAYRSRATPAAVLGTLATFEIRYDLPVVFCSDAAAAAHQVETWVWYAAREQAKTTNGMTA